MSSDEELLSLLACPRCDSRPPLRREGSHLICTECGAAYPIIDGIIHLLPESAEQIKETTDANSH